MDFIIGLSYMGRYATPRSTMKIYAPTLNPTMMRSKSFPTDFPIWWSLKIREHTKNLQSSRISHYYQTCHEGCTKFSGLGLFLINDWSLKDRRYMLDYRRIDDARKYSYLLCGLFIYLFILSFSFFKGRLLHISSLRQRFHLHPTFFNTFFYKTPFSRNF